MSGAQVRLLSAPIAPTRGPSSAAKALPDDGTRIENDAYYTPDQVAAACVAAVHAVEPIDGVVLEPHAGGGAFARALLSQTDAKVILTDVDPEAAALSGWSPSGRSPMSATVRDFLTERHITPRWIVGNPPYVEAEDHVRHALDRSRRHVVFLLRLGFLESRQRRAFWSRAPLRHVWVLAKRPSFSACGRTDGCAYGLFWWDKGWSGPAGITACWDWENQETHTIHHLEGEKR